MELPWLLVKAGEKERLIKCLTTASVFWSLNRFEFTFRSLLCSTAYISFIHPSKNIGKCLMESFGRGTQRLVSVKYLFGEANIA